MPSEEPEYEAPKPTESVPENMSSSSNEKLFTFIGLVLVVIIIGLIAFIATTHEKKPTGYETTTKFVEDGDYRDEREFEDMMTEGWEVMHQRRAWSERYYGASKDWGTEYTMRKPTFD